MKILLLSVFLTLAALGWMLGGNHAPSAKSESISAAAARPHRPARPAARISGPGGVGGRQLAAIRASRDRGARMRATVDLANSLAPADFAAWLDRGWFATQDGPELALFTIVVTQRWQAEDPEGWLVRAFGKKDPAGEAFLGEWARTDPAKTLAFFKQHPNQTAELRTLSIMAKENPDIALRRLQEMAGEGISEADVERNAVWCFLTLAEKSPVALEAALASFPGELGKMAESCLIGARMSKSPDEELAKLKKRPDGADLLARIFEKGVTNSAERNIMRERLFAGLAELSPSWRSAIASSPYYLAGGNTAASWIQADLEGAGFTKQQAKSIRSQVLRSLYAEPGLALRLLPDVKYEEGERHEFLRSIFRQLHDQPEKAVSLAAMLESSEDREFALAQASPAKDPTTPAKIDTPAGWLDGLAALDPTNNQQTFNLMSATAKWDEGKLAELSQQFDALPAAAKAAAARNATIQSYGNSNPLEGAAIRYLTGHLEAATGPVESGGDDTPENRTSKLASLYVAKSARTDPAGTASWIATLPAGPAKSWAGMNLHTLWSRYDPPAAAGWLNSLPAPGRQEIEKLRKR